MPRRGPSDPWHATRARKDNREAADSTAIQFCDPLALQERVPLRHFGEQQKPRSLSVVNCATNQNGLRGTGCQRGSFSDSSMTTILQRGYFFCGLILYHPH